jgi:hypothetical protein
MDDRSEFQAFALEFRRKAQTASSPAAREIWNMVADRWLRMAICGERQGPSDRPGEYRASRRREGCASTSA